MAKRQDKSAHLLEHAERKRNAVDNNKLSADLFFLEEKLILERDMSNDVVVHQEVLDNLVSIIKKVNHIKSSKNPQDTEELRRLRMEGMVEFTMLKKMNRLGHLRSKCIREQTQEAKQCIDDHHLQLQNLLYEILHLQKEILKCLQFKSKHESISLVSKEEFKKCQPVKKMDDHKLMLARMDWELKERIKLSEKLRECSIKKEEMLKQVASKKHHLSTLQPKLQDILEVSRPLQEDLNLRITEEREQLKMVPKLPPPLHLLFIQASSLSHYKKGVRVEIQGDAQLVEEGETFELEESDSEDEGKHKKGKHKRSAEDKLARKRQELLKTHPLIIVLTSSSSRITFQLTFHYFVHLHFVSVAFKFNSSNLPLTHHLFSPSSFLSDLFQAYALDGSEVVDCGDVSPNPFNSYVLNKLEIDDLTMHLTEQHGRPYKWVQTLCGLDALVMGGVRKVGVEGVLKMLNDRITHRVSLHRIIQSLVSCDTSFLSESPCKLTSFSEEEYNKLHAETPQHRHFSYQGTLQHNEHTLTFSLSISYSYPTFPCVFRLKSASVSALNHQDIRELECKVNCAPPLPHDQLLPYQLTSLLGGFCLLHDPVVSRRGPLRSIQF